VIEEWAWKTIAARVRKGYVPPPPRAVLPRWWLTEKGRFDVPITLREIDSAMLPEHFARFEAGVGFVLPTALRRSRGTLHQKVAELRDQILDVHREASQAVLLVIGLQWLEGEEQEALTLLEQALAVAPLDERPMIAILGLTLRGPGKANTLRTCIPLISRLGLRGLGWVDDDILLMPACLAHLVKGFLRRDGRPCVVGGTKIPRQREATASRWLFRLKQRMDPATNYPHGCCMLVDASLFDRGIPDRYCCDDGYFCYEMLRRAPDECEERLALIPEALCQYWVGADRGRLLPRLRRLLLNHVVFLADYPHEVGEKYLSDYLYPGFWPISRVATKDGVKISDPTRWSLQLFHLLCLSSIAFELVVRGIVGHPLREIHWAG